MAKDSFIFMHRYHKFGRRWFTTIRGATAAKQYKEGQTVDIILRDNSFGFPVISTILFQAEIKGFAVMRLKDIPLGMLKVDAEFPGFTIKDHWGFVSLLNSFRRYNKIRSLEERVTVFNLEKIKVR